MSIELRDVTFSYPNGFTANKNLNLKIREGEKIAIVGQNGAGKTTAVKLMNGLNRPESGEVWVNGENIQNKTCAQISREVGYVFQNPDDQIFNSTVRAEIEYMPRYLKLKPEEIKNRCDKAIQITGIEKYEKMNPLDIPYGIRKFVAIAAIIATKPRYIILDEPTAGQDNRGNTILRNIIEGLHKENIGIIAITHDMEFVVKNFERIVVMANKKIIADSEVRKVFWDNEVIREAQIKKPQIAELAEQLKLDEEILYARELTNKIIQGEY